MNRVVKHSRQGPNAARPAAVVFVVSIILYSSTLAPTVSVGDSGELIVAAHSLGVCHPPGYPLWCLLGFMFSHLVPIGEVAWRLNAMSAVLGAAAAAGIAALLARRRAREWAAIAAGLLFACGTTLWSQAVVTEVYTLSAVACVALLLALDRCRTDLRPCTVAAAACVLGLGLAAHPNSILLVPAAVATILIGIRNQPVHNAFWVLAASQLFWIGPLLYAVYLPLAAIHDPVINWGDPSTPQAWLEHVTRAQYGGYQWPGLGPTLESFRGFLGLVGRELAWIGLVPFFTGALFFPSSNGGRRIDLIGFLCIGPLYSILLAGLLRGEQLLEIEVYFIPSLAYACVFVGQGLHLLEERTTPAASTTASRRAFAGGILILVSLMALHRFDRVDQRGNRVAHDYARALLTSMPHNADLYAQGDHELFPIMYVQQIEGYREEVRIYDAAVPGEPTDVYGTPRWDDPNRPKLVTVPLGGFSGQTVPWGLALLMIEEGVPVPSPRRPPALGHQPPMPADSLGFFERDLLARYHLFQARFALAVGDLHAAVIEIEHGARIGGDNPKVLNNLATFCGQSGLNTTAASLWQRALELDPDYRLARGNLESLTKRPATGSDDRHAE
jgi:hypothetical protein